MRTPESGGANPFDADALIGGDHGLLARTLAAALIARDMRDEAFWANWTETNLAAHAALLQDLHAPPDRTMSTLFDLLYADVVDYEIARRLDLYKTSLCCTAHRGLAAYLQLPDKETRPSVLASTQQHVRLWENDLIRSLTDRTTFDLRALVAGEPMSIYIIASPARLEALAPFGGCGWGHWRESCCCRSAGSRTAT